MTTNRLQAMKARRQALDAAAQQPEPTMLSSTGQLSRRRRGSSPERMGELIRTRWAQHRARQQAEHVVIDPESRPDIITFTTDPDYLGLPLSPMQTVILKSTEGLPLSDAEYPLWLKATHRPEYPAHPFAEVTVLAGSRGGKTSRIEVPCLLYAAIYGGFEVHAGETVCVVLVAQDRDAARIALKLCKDYLKRSPALSSFVVSDKANELELSNGIIIRAYPCTSKSIYGYSVIAGGMDEVGRFRIEGAADTDEDVQSVIQRGMIHYRERAPKLIKCSTPLGKSGLLYSDYQRAFGKPDDHLLVFQCTSLDLNPGELNEDMLRELKQRDPTRYARLYEAEFSEDVLAWLQGATIEEAVNKSVREIAPVTGGRYTFACDAAAHGADDFTLAGVLAEGTGPETRVTQVVLGRWSKPRSGTRDLKATVRGIQTIMARYGVKKLYGDRVTGGWVLEAFRDVGVEYVYPSIERKTVGPERTEQAVYLDRSKIYSECGPLFRTGALKILDDHVLVRELRNIEQRGDKIGPGFGIHDDSAVSLCLAAVMAMTSSVAPRPAASAVRGSGIGGRGGIGFGGWQDATRSWNQRYGQRA